MIARGKIQGTVLTLLSLSPILILALAGWSLFVGERRDGFPNSDIIVYSIVAKLWNEGFIPYRDIADHKPPVMYIFLRLCMRTRLVLKPKSSFWSVQHLRGR
ncbi:MAG: hypothetical protein RL326_642 [Pseudomonadota bacterium]|jgi:hypothetical protein